jgi:hypothetical protein
MRSGTPEWDALQRMLDQPASKDVTPDQASTNLRLWAAALKGRFGGQTVQ